MCMYTDILVVKHLSNLPDTIYGVYTLRCASCPTGRKLPVPGNQGSTTERFMGLSLAIYMMIHSTKLRGMKSRLTGVYF